MNDSQSGFRKGHSTSTCLLFFLEGVFNNMDKGGATGVAFLDLKQAFDTVDHDILLDKLDKYGMDADTVRWFESYLRGHTQATKVHGQLSEELGVRCGSRRGPYSDPCSSLYSLTTCQRQ